MDKLQARKTAYLIAAELIDVEHVESIAFSSQLIETDEEAKEVADALVELRAELVARADLDDDDDHELVERYQKLNSQLEQDDHAPLIEKLRASAAHWDSKLSE